MKLGNIPNNFHQLLIHSANTRIKILLFPSADIFLFLLPFHPDLCLPNRLSLNLQFSSGSEQLAHNFFGYSLKGDIVPSILCWGCVGALSVKSNGRASVLLCYTTPNNRCWHFVLLDLCPSCALWNLV